MTAKEIPNMPAMVVKTMLSDKICCRMSLGRAPMARRMPISPCDGYQTD